MLAAKAETRKPIPFFQIRINSVATGIPLPFDIYLYVAEKPVLFRKRGDIITPDRLKLLHHHGGEQFLVPEEHRVPYLDSLKNIIHDPSTTTELKAKFIKESAFLHVQDLFTKDNMSGAVKDANSLVEDMVTFVSTDVAAVSTLMRLSVHDYYTYNHCVDVAVYSIVLATPTMARSVWNRSTASLMPRGLSYLSITKILMERDIPEV